MVKHTQTIHRLMPTNCLSVFDHFVGRALKGLNKLIQTKYILLPASSNGFLKLNGHILIKPSRDPNTQ